MHLRRAFTLIELSIVILIIGLLAGGIVAGRSLLRQSQVNSIMTDAQRYMQATQQFQQKYNFLPGDFPNATTYWGAAAGSSGTNWTTDCYATGSVTSPATCNGNGDGQVDLTTTTTYVNEMWRFWQHLSDAQLIPGAYSGVAGSVGDTAQVVGTNSPGSRIDTGGFVFGFAGIRASDSSYFDGTYNHVLYFGAPLSGITNSGPILTPAELLAFDTKYDDGLPGAGSIRTWKGSVYDCANGSASTSAYDLTQKNPTCAIQFITGF